MTSLLSGTAALLPRLGTGLFTAWLRAGGEQADRDRPFRLHLELVDHLDNAIHITVPKTVCWPALVRESRTPRIAD